MDGITRGDKGKDGGVCGKVVENGQNRWEGGRDEAVELMTTKGGTRESESAKTN